MNQLILENIWIFILILLWVLPWKGVALWKSARNGDKFWFVALLAIQTLAVLEIIYIFVFSKKETKENITENRQNS